MKIKYNEFQLWLLLQSSLITAPFTSLFMRADFGTAVVDQAC